MTTDNRYESWAQAFYRILHEVTVEHPDWDEQEQYFEYRRRCEAWKRARGIR